MYPAAQQYIIHLSNNKRRTNSRTNSSRMISLNCFSSVAAGKSILLLTIVAIVLLGRPVNSLGSCKEAGLCCTGRDASCVVQKTPQNAIIEDLRDTPCYCDHACLKLNDCCPDYRQTCGGTSNHTKTSPFAPFCYYIHLLRCIFIRLFAVLMGFHAEIGAGNEISLAKKKPIDNNNITRGENGNVG
jgi:hypothetical protein